MKKIFFLFREKLKKILAIETARAAVVTQWTKKIIVEKQTLSNDQDPALVRCLNGEIIQLSDLGLNLHKESLYLITYKN